MTTSHDGPLARNAWTMARIVQYGEDCGLATADWVLARRRRVFASGSIHGSRKELEAWMDAFTVLAGEPDDVQVATRAGDPTLITAATWWDYSTSPGAGRGMPEESLEPPHIHDFGGRMRLTAGEPDGPHNALA